MAKNKYDIFISYRRKDSGDKAEHLKDLLEQGCMVLKKYQRETSQVRCAKKAIKQQTTCISGTLSATS